LDAQRPRRLAVDYAGKEETDPNYIDMQFEDYLEKIRIDNNFGMRTVPETRKKNRTTNWSML